MNLMTRQGGTRGPEDRHELRFARCFCALPRRSVPLRRSKACGKDVLIARESKRLLISDEWKLMCFEFLLLG
jgi:hypothetical protein